MKITVKLYGTLGRLSPGYVHSEGTVVEIPDNGRVKDLLSAFTLDESQEVAVVMNGRILSKDDELPDGAHVNVMQSLHGEKSIQTTSGIMMFANTDMVVIGQFDCSAQYVRLNAYRIYMTVLFQRVPNIRLKKTLRILVKL